jgi:pyrimidine-nucleoside phosphorylase
VDLSVAEYRRLVREVGACLIGQTATLAPADKKLYALRDVTATVDCIPLIASSIMSKKLAEGIDALVLDVKVGSGAFMKTREQARALAETLVGIGRGAGKRVTAFLTDMEQPLGRYVGNALEVREAILTLRGEGSPDVRALTLALGAEMLRLAGLVGDGAEGEREAHARLEAVIQSGAALERFARIAEAQGGDPEAVIGDALPTAPDRAEVQSPKGGVVTSINAEAVGLSALVLGAGRLRKEDLIDPAVGLVLEKKVGDTVRAGEPLVLLHHRGGHGVDEARFRLLRAYTIGDAGTPSDRAPRPLILEVLR